MLQKFPDEEKEALMMLQKFPIKSEESLFEIKKIIFDIKCIYNFCQKLEKKEERFFKEVNQLSVEKEIMICDIINLNHTRLTILYINTTIIILDQSNISYLKPLFTKVGQIYFSNEESEKEFKTKIPGIKQSYSNLFSSEDIELFESKLHFHCKKENQPIIKTIQTAVATFILIKSFIQTKNHRHEQKSDTSIKEYTYDDFIFIRNEGSSTNLYFNLNDQHLYILKKFNSNDYLSQRRYEREIECYRKIDNKYPFISKYYGEFEYYENKYIVIEYIEGQTLKMLKSKNKNKINLNYEEKIKIIIEILLSVEYFHSKGIILRDLKWDNIIIDSNHDCILIDFDFTKINDSDFFEMTSDIGSNLFSAPEQLMGNDYSYQVDLFSVGMIINFIICEQLIEGKDFFDDLNNEIPKFPGIFLPLASLYRKLLSNSPEDRPNISSVLNRVFVRIPAYIKSMAIKDNDNKISEMVKKMIKIRYHFLLEIFQNKSVSPFIDLSEIYNFLGVIYNTGEVFQKDTEMAHYYYSIASELNNSYARSNLGFFYLYDNPNIEKSLYYFNLSANQNNSMALYELGEIYFKGIYVKKDLKKANEYFSKAGKTDDLLILEYLGNHYLNDYPKDINKSIYYYSCASKLHSSLAQLNLGLIFISNEHVPRDIEKAIYYFSLAANQKYPLAEIFFGNSDIDINNSYSSIMKKEILKNSTKSLIYFAFEYYLGDIKKRNIHMAIYFFNLASQKNDPMAQYYLGEIYMKDNNLRDINKSIYYLNLSSNNNYSPAQYLLGINYYFGKYLAKDINKAIHFLTLSAKNNDKYAQTFLGYLYIYGEKSIKNINQGIYYLNLALKQNFVKAQLFVGMINMDNSYIPCDIKKSIHYLTLASNQNDPFAQLILGVIYYNEINDVQKSIYYLNLSANQNYRYAQYYLGTIYFNGKGIKRDVNKAIHYFQLASKKNVDEANLYLGQIYYEGKYLPKNINKSIHYLTLSARENNSNAQYLLGEIYYHTEKNIDINKCIYYLNLSAKQNNQYANYFLGVLYFKGKHVQKDINKAIQYFKNAANLNHPFAKNNLGCIYLNINFSYSIEYFNENVLKCNDCLSICNLAKIYYFGINVERNVDKSIQLLKIVFEEKYFIADLFLFLILYNDEYYEESQEYYKLIYKKYNYDFLDIFLDKEKCENALNLFRITCFDYGLSSKHLINFIQKFLDIDFNLFETKKNNIFNHRKQDINHDFYEGFGSTIS